MAVLTFICQGEGELVCEVKGPCLHVELIFAQKLKSGQVTCLWKHNVFRLVQGDVNGSARFGFVKGALTKRGSFSGFASLTVLGAEVSSEDSVLVMGEM